MSTESTEIDIFEYFDYRKFLNDYLRQVKTSRPSFSMRAFSRHCGFNSPNYMSLILSQRRNLNSKTIARVTKACRLDAQQSRYFKALVEWNQSQEEDKDLHFDEIYRIQLGRKQKVLSKSQNVILGKWYYHVLREMVLLPHFENDPNWIAQRLGYQLAPHEIEKAFEILIQQGLLKKRGKKLVQADAVVTTTDDEASKLIQQYHIDMIPQSIRAIRTNDVSDRDFRSMTMALSKKNFREIKKEIKKLEERVIEIATKETQAEEVYQLNLQLFHITQGKIS